MNSISKICDRGNTVIFGSNGGVIVNNVSGEEKCSSQGNKASMSCTRGDEFCLHFVDFSFCPAGDVAHGVSSVSPSADSEVVPGERGEIIADEEESSEEKKDD